MIAGMRHLKFLDVSGNRINHLDVEAFQTTPRLANLLLQNNEITEIVAGSFENLNGLRHLNLAGNKISTIDDGTFRGLDRVEDITLDDNEISALPPIAFNNTPRLSTLTARRNLVRIVDLTLVDFARRVRHLDLAQNLVSSVVLPDPVTVNSVVTEKPTSAATNTTARPAVRHGGFETLSLVDNLLESVDERITSMVRMPLRSGPHRGTGGGTLRLHGNPWACDCRLLWLVDAVSRARVRTVGKMSTATVVDRQSVDDMLCKSPSYLAGRKVNDTGLCT